MFLEIDAIEILRGLKKFWKLSFTCGLLGALTGGLGITLLPSYWTATATFTLVDGAVSTNLKGTEILQMNSWFEDTNPVLLYPEVLKTRFVTELQNRKNQIVFATDFLRNSGIQNEKLPEQSSKLSTSIAKNLVLKQEDEALYSVRLTADNPELAETLLKQYIKFVTDTSIANTSREIRSFLDQILKKLELQSRDETIKYMTLLDEILVIQESIEWLSNDCSEKDGRDCANKFDIQERITKTEQLLTDRQAKFSSEIIERGLIPSIREANARAKQVRQIKGSVEYDEIKLITLVGDYRITQESKPISLILFITTMLGLVIGFFASGMREVTVTKAASN